MVTTFLYAFISSICILKYLQASELVCFRVFQEKIWGVDET